MPSPVGNSNQIIIGIRYPYTKPVGKRDIKQALNLTCPEISGVTGNCRELAKQKESGPKP